MVGNGSILEYNNTSPQVNMDIQGHRFTLDLFHLPLSGVDIVLGVQWLKSLGPVTTDYDSLTMSYIHLRQTIHLFVMYPSTYPLPQPNVSTFK